ncbi:MAG: ABC transporter substrate-binding protein [Dehalococcoidia bacterium]
MVQDRAGGPVWMLLEPLLGVHSTRDREGNLAVDFEDIDKSVEVEGDWVVFHLKNPCPPFIHILAWTWSSIIPKDWAIAQGAWDGTKANWKDYNNPEQPPLQGVANGTGPYKLQRWDPGVELVLTKNENYWREPADIKTVMFKVVQEWSTRKLMLQNGDADGVYVPRAHIHELEGAEGIRVHKDLPSLELVTALFNLTSTHRAST